MKLINSLVSLVVVLLILAVSPAPPGKTTDHGWSGLADHPGYVTSHNDSTQVQELATFIGASTKTSCPNAGLNGVALDASVSEVRPYEVSTRVVSYFDSMHGSDTVNTMRWCGYADSNAPSAMRV